MWPYLLGRLHVRLSTWSAEVSVRPGMRYDACHETRGRRKKLACARGQTACLP